MDSGPGSFDMQSISFCLENSIGSLKRMSNIGSLLRIYYKDKEGVLHSLQGFTVSEMVLHAILRGERSIKTTSFPPGDLIKLKRRGLGTESQVDLVVEFVWDGSCILKVVVEANDKQIQRQILAMAVDRIRKTASLNKILAWKGLKTCKVRENPYLGPGHAPYENFIESLLEKTDTSTSDGKKLLELFLQSAEDEADKSTLTSVEKCGLRTVFHGTDHAVMDAILKSGLDPNRRKSFVQKDFFGIDYFTSLLYTKRNTRPRVRCVKLLVFLIIGKSTGSLDPAGEVTVESNKFQLPLAEITLEESDSFVYEGYEDEVDEDEYEFEDEYEYY